MGHIRLGRLPRTVRWKRVIELLNESASVNSIAQASLEAAEKGLAAAPTDEGFTRTLATIFDFLDAVHSKDAAAALSHKGFQLPQDPSLLDYTISFRKQVDANTAGLKSKSDLSEIAASSFTEVVVKKTTPLLPSLFSTSSTEVKSALQAGLKGKQLQQSMHEFFVVFTNKYLQYYLSRAMADHVGMGRALSNTDDHTEFKSAFETYIRQTVRITDEFTPGWFGKARFEGRLSRNDVSRYAHVAFKKIRSEFRMGAEPHG